VIFLLGQNGVGKTSTLDRLLHITCVSASTYSMPVPSTVAGSSYRLRGVTRVHLNTNREQRRANKSSGSRASSSGGALPVPTGAASSATAAPDTLHRAGSRGAASANSNAAQPTPMDVDSAPPVPTYTVRSSVQKAASDRSYQTANAVSASNGSGSGQSALISSNKAGRSDWGNGGGRELAESAESEFKTLSPQFSIVLMNEAERKLYLDPATHEAERKSYDDVLRNYADVTLIKAANFSSFMLPCSQ